MKKIFTLLIFIYSTLLFAQNNSTTDATVEIPNWSIMLSNLNNAQITSGVLLDKVVDYSNITNFNTIDKNVSDNNHFRQALSELYKASDQTRFISTTALNALIVNTTAINSVDIGIINTLFHRLNFNEDNANLTGVTYNGTQFAIVAGKSTFIGKKALIIAPLKDIVIGNSINFNFKTSLIFNNATTNIKSLVATFNDQSNNAITIINNSSIVVPTASINYTSSGFKTITFLTTFTDNTTITTFATVNVTLPPAVSTSFSGGASNTADLCAQSYRLRGVYPSTPTEIAASIPFPSYGETTATYGKIEYTVFYSDNNTAKKMIKPIIIVDGFDPKDKRKVQDCDCENDPVCVLANRNLLSVTYTPQIINGQTINTPLYNFAFNPIKHVSIEDSMLYDISPTQKINFMSQLRTLGYDVIIINQPTYSSVDTAGNAKNDIDGGADYIERNALALVSFIKNYVKPQQVVAGSTQGLVLIGPSMGGQITRYALAYMEKKFAETGNTTWQHNARLWVSVDSPHLGASIPVGAQANIWFTADPLNKEEAQKSYADLNSVAGQQQSITNFEYARTSPTHNLANSPYFSTYYNNLNSNGVSGSNGYPVTTTTFRKIAMINGSLTGVKHGTEGQSFLYSRVYIRGLFPFQSSTITLARFHDSFMAGYGNTGQVFQGDGQTTRFSLHLFGGCNPCLPHPRYSLNVTNNDIRGSLDIVPGGFFKFGETLKNSIEDGASSGGFRSETTDYVASNSFIAAFSSLGHLNPWQNWSNPLNTNLTCSSNKQTPFDSYWGSDTNTEHTTFTKEGIDWLLKELAGKPQAPHFPIQEGLLVGAKTICENENKTYTFNEVCKVPSSLMYNNDVGVAVNGWSVEGNLQIVSFTAYSVTVKGTSNVPNDAKIIATFQNGQRYETIVHVGVPSYNGFIPISGTYSWVPRGYSASHAVSFPVSTTATSYKWTIALDSDDIGTGFNCNGVSNPYLARFNSISNGINNSLSAMAITTGQPVATWYSTTPNASINWGRCSGNYALSITLVNECGEIEVSTKYVTVGSPASNPCRDDMVITSNFRMIVSPNPITTTETTINLTPNHIPCDQKDMKPLINYREIYGENYIVKMYDLNGVQKYAGEFVLRDDEETFSFKVADINLADNYYILEVLYPDNYLERQMIILDKN